MPVVEPEILDPEVEDGNGEEPEESTALALPKQMRSAAADALHAAAAAVAKAEVGKLAEQMEKRWLEERFEREKWVESDEARKVRLQRKNSRERMAGMMAAALVSEGAVGTRYKADQIASYAVEVADAVLKELDRVEQLVIERARADHAAVGPRCPECKRPHGEKT